MHHVLIMFLRLQVSRGCRDAGCVTLLSMEGVDKVTQCKRQLASCVPCIRVYIYREMNTPFPWVEHAHRQGITKWSES